MNYEFEADEKTMIFIDGYNIYTTVRALNMDLDFDRFLSFFKEKAPVIRAYYYTTISEEQGSVQTLIDWLDYNGYDTLSKPVREYTDANGRKRYKGSITVDLTVKALQMAAHCDHIVIVSGDGDYLPVVKAIQDMGKKVTVVSTISTSVPMVSDELRRAADYFIDIHSIAKYITRQTAA